MRRLERNSTPAAAQPSAELKRRYVELLRRRIDSIRDHLSDVASLAEEWDLEMGRGVDSDISSSSDVLDVDLWSSAMAILDRADDNGQLQELRPLLVVDKAELEQDLARLHRQLGLLNR